MKGGRETRAEQPDGAGKDLVLSVHLARESYQSTMNGLLVALQSPQETLVQGLRNHCSVEVGNSTSHSGCGTEDTVDMGVEAPDSRSGL